MTCPFPHFRMSRVRKLSLFAACAVVFLAGASQAKGQFSKDVMRPALWEKVQFRAAHECGLGLQECSAGFLEEAGFEIGERPIYEFFTLGKFRGRDLTIVFVTVDVEDDDLVAGIRYRLVLSLHQGESDNLKLSSIGKQYKCFRSTQEWSKARCR